MVCSEGVGGWDILDTDDREFTDITSKRNRHKSAAWEVTAGYLRTDSMNGYAYEIGVAKGTGI